MKTRTELEQFDFELLQKQVSGNLKAALSGNKEEYDNIKKIQNDKGALKQYLGEKEPEEDKEDDAISEKYDKDLEKPAY